MENSYGKVWYSEEGKARITKGLDKIGRALDLLERERPGCSEKYIAATSIHFRQTAAMTAASSEVSTFKIYCWLRYIVKSKGNKPYMPLAIFIDDHFKKKTSTTVKEAVKNGRKHNAIRKKSLHTEVGKVRSHILPHEERTKDYINGVKYRVIIYFGRNVK